MSATKDLAGAVHVETAIAKRPFTLRPGAGNAHLLNVATLNREVNGGRNGSLLSNTGINGRLPSLRLALYPTRTVAS